MCLCFENNIACLFTMGRVHKIYISYGSGLMNLNFEGRKAIDQAPTSVKSIEVRDGGHTTQTDMANMYCSKCSAHVGWKIVRIVIPLFWILSCTVLSAVLMLDGK